MRKLCEYTYGLLENVIASHDDVAVGRDGFMLTWRAASGYHKVIRVDHRLRFVTVGRARRVIA